MTIEQQQKSKSKGGRPPMLNIEKRSIKYHGGFTVAEAQMIAEKAAAAGITESEYIRHAVLAREFKTVPAVNKETYQELGKIGVNINQIAHSLNVSASSTDKERINLVFNKFMSAIGEIRKQLLGVA